MTYLPYQLYKTIKQFNRMLLFKQLFTRLAGLIELFVKRNLFCFSFQDHFIQRFHLFNKNVTRNRLHSLIKLKHTWNRQRKQLPVGNNRNQVKLIIKYDSIRFLKHELKGVLKCKGRKFRPFSRARRVEPDPIGSGS